MKSLGIINAIVSLIAICSFSSCECSDSSKSYHNNSIQNNMKTYGMSQKQMEDIRLQQRLQELLKQYEQEQHPVQRIRIQSSDAYDRGYTYGWDAGYDDAYYGYGAWANYDESGKGGDFLNGYESGYIDGYEEGKKEREDEYEDDDEYEEIEDL